MHVMVVSAIGKSDFYVRYHIGQRLLLYGTPEPIKLILKIRRKNKKDKKY